MTKIIFVSRLILMHGKKRFLLILLISFIMVIGFTLTAGTFYSIKGLQSYATNANLDRYILHSFSDEFWMPDESIPENRRTLYNKLKDLPDCAGVFNQVLTLWADNYAMIYAYPSLLYFDMDLPLVAGYWPKEKTCGDSTPIILDYRFRKEYSIGDRIDASLAQIYDGSLTKKSFTVCGFLSKDAPYFDFCSGQSFTSTNSFLSYRPEARVGLTLSDGWADTDEYTMSNGLTQLLLANDEVEQSQAVSRWKEIAEREGFGIVSSMKDARELDSRYLQLVISQIMILSTVLLIVTLLGYIGFHAMMQDRCRKIAVSLNCIGASERVWILAWFLPMLITQLAVFAAGAFLGTRLYEILLSSLFPATNVLAQVFTIAVLLLVLLAMTFVVVKTWYARVDLWREKRCL